jgi:flagellar hook-associated protein 1 FlgK
MSEFAGLQIALSALQAQQRAIELSAQNVANANTPGYSRQVANLTNIGAPATPALFSTYTGAGGGVQVDSITRYRDQFLEIQAALQHGASAAADQGATTMNNIQQLFNEPTDQGIGQQLSDFWSGFDDVANNPDDPAARTQLLSRAQTLVQSFNSTSSSLTQQRTNTIGELGANITQINGWAQQIAQLNQTIKQNTIANLPVNDLEDQRDLLANQLAEASGATLQAGQFNQVNVVLNGSSLVQENNSYSLTLDTSGNNAVVRFAETNNAATITSGTAGGQLVAINTTIPGYITKLDNVASTLANEVNQLHDPINGSLAVGSQDQSAAGNLQFQISLDGGAFSNVSVAGADWSGAGGATALQTALQSAVDASIGAGNATVTVSGGNGSALSVSIAPAGTHQLQVQATAGNNGFSTLLGTTPVGSDGIGGRAFFTGTTAATFALTNLVANNPAAVAAGLAAGGPLDGSNAIAMANLAGAPNGADAAYQNVVVQVGSDTQTATSRDQFQQQATTSIDNARQQYSGVSVDEEMTNMVEFQHAYEAAARFTSTINSMLDTLINHTGLS